MTVHAIDAFATSVLSMHISYMACTSTDTSRQPKAPVPHTMFYGESFWVLFAFTERAAATLNLVNVAV